METKEEIPHGSEGCAYDDRSNQISCKNHDSSIRPENVDKENTLNASPYFLRRRIKSSAGSKVGETHEEEGAVKQMVVEGDKKKKKEAKKKISKMLHLEDHVRMFGDEHDMMLG